MVSEAVVGMEVAPYALAAFVAVAVVLPLGVLHYAVAWRKAYALNVKDERLLWNLWTAAKRMEHRVATLERLMDLDAPLAREGRRDHVRKTH